MSRSRTYTILNNDGDIYQPEVRKFNNDTDLWNNVVDDIKEAKLNDGFMYEYDYPIRAYTVDWTKNEITIFFAGLPDG